MGGLIFPIFPRMGSFGTLGIPIFPTHSIRVGGMGTRRNGKEVRHDG
jgi:hypothetical protein